MTLRFSPRWCLRGLLLLAAGSLAGCGPIVELPGGGDNPPRLYTLTPVSSTKPPQASPLTIFVEEPSAPGELRGNRFVVVEEDGRVSFLGGARWVDRTPRMLQRYLASSLDSVLPATVLGTANAIDLPADYRLKCDVQDLRLVPEDGKVVLKLHARLVRNGPVQIIASRHFEAQSTADPDDTAAVFAAGNAALDDVARGLASWLSDLELSPRGS